MNNPDPSLLQASLAEFVRYRNEYLKGDEKGEAQVFCDRLFKAFGHGGVREAGATLEMRLRRDDEKGTAFADLVWKPRVLIEMKKAGTTLNRHYRQAFDYWIKAVPNRPRYVVLCNFDEFWIYDFDSQLDAPVDKVRIAQLPQRRDAMSFMLPVEERPLFERDLVRVTRKAAENMALLFRSINHRGLDRQVAQRFVLQSVMGMFAEDIGLLPGKFFSRALSDATNGSSAYDLIFNLFREMNSPGKTKGGRYKGTPYFNGGLFASVDPIELSDEELELLREAAKTDWSDVRPEIFGTLFEGSMDVGERHAQGAHFTSQADIAKVVIPTIVEPWRKKLAAAGSIRDLEKILGGMFSFRVLDPACGSGNFLYVAYREMRRLEHEALEMIQDRRRSAEIAAQTRLAYVTPDHFFGIDKNPFAVEIAKVTLLLAKKLAADELGEDQAVLPLDNLDQNIVHADALFTQWPKSDVVIGNPPFVARRDMVGELGAGYTSRLSRSYPNVSGVSDFVCYWFPLAHDHIAAGGRAGFVATATIRENDSRKASLDYVVDHGGTITEAVSTQPWSGDAAVHVSIVNWVKGDYIEDKILWLNDGELRIITDRITSALSADVDVRGARSLAVNKVPKTVYQGQAPGVTDGFVVDASTKSQLLKKGPDEASAIHPFLGGVEMVSKISIDRWVIDIPDTDLLVAETTYPVLMKHLEEWVLPKRKKAADKQQAENEMALREDPNAKLNAHHVRFLDHWWQLVWRRKDMLDALKGLDRYIATNRQASRTRASIFSFIDSSIHPGDTMTVFAFSDDYSMGILSSHIHRLWLNARCSTFKGDPRYTSTTVWDSFPWPQAPGEVAVRSIVEVTKRMIDLRQTYLDRGINLRAQYTSLQRPGKNELRDIHLSLDEAVHAAYGFSKDDDILAQLLALNQTIDADPDIARGPGGGGLPRSRVTDYRLRAPKVG